MKIVLTAFQGKLRSKPMDWPDEMRGRDMHLVMDMERTKFKEPEIGLTPTILKSARFEATGRFGVLPNRDTYEEYKLVDIS